jgi:hypothetical protein
VAEQPTRIGRFDIKLELGRGAMGRVYLAHDPKIDRQVAIKTIHVNPGTSQAEAGESHQRFFREAQAAGRLVHPGIVTIFDVGEEKGVSYIAMEYIDGPTLEAATKPDNLLPVEKVVQIVIQTSQALHHAHQHKIIHRDVKPANLMLVEDRQVKVTDFGLAKNPAANLTSAGTLIGTPTYMSPEQIMGKALDGRSDLFSLAVVLYEMLTGDRPFGGENISTIIYNILLDHPKPPDFPNPRVPTPLVKVILKALDKDPSKRYASCAEFGAVLQEYLKTGKSGRSSMDRSTAQAHPPTELLDHAVAAEAASAVADGPALELLESPARSVASDSKMSHGDAAAVAAAGAAAGAAVAAATIQSAVRPRPRSRVPLVAFVVVVILAGGSAAAVYFKPEILHKIGLGEYAERLGLATASMEPALEPSEPRAGPAAGPPVDLPAQLPEGEVVTIAVGTDPPGGRIYMDNQEVIGGSISLGKDDGDAHTLVAENDCFVDRARVRAGETDSLTIPLETPKLHPVRVVSEPPGAALSVDGRSAGTRTPADLNLAACQPHTISAGLEGYKGSSLEFGADTDWIGNSTVTLQLPELPDGFVSVKAPYAVEVMEGDNALGRSGRRIKLRAGKHRLTFVNTDLFVRVSSQVDVPPDGTVTPKVNFPGVGEISVHANPSNGEIYVNGRKLGPPPILGHSLAEGTYKIKYVLQTGESDEKTVLVIAGQREPVKFLMK